MYNTLNVMRYLVALLSVALFWQPASAQGQTETRYVSDQFEVTLRTGPSTGNAISRMLPSGTELEVLERDEESGWSRVRTRAGTEGWVLNRYLMRQPAARDRLAALQERFDALRNQSGDQGKLVDDLRQETREASERIRALEAENKRLQAELEEIRRTAANVLTIDKQNRELRQKLSEAEIAVGSLQRENAELGTRRIQNWFMAGGVVMLTGVVVGLIVPRLRFTRRRRRFGDSF